MGSVLVIVIIIVVVCVQLRQKARRGAQAERTEGAARPAPRTMKSEREASRGKAAPKISRRRKQRHISRDFAEKTGASSYREPEHRENILSAARANTAEVARGNDMDALMSEHLMEDVYDIMVKGPRDTLTFSRDFVAEGIDLLNRYTTLPDTDHMQHGC